MLCEWIAATVQASRRHSAAEMNRGGPVAAISLSALCMHCAARLAAERIALQFGVIPVCSPPRPTPNPSLMAFVLQVHICMSSITMGVGGCMG